MCLGVFCLGFILFGTLWVSWTCVTISFPILGKFSAIISSSIFSWPFFLSSSSGTPMIWLLGHFTLFQRSLRLSRNRRNIPQHNKSYIWQTHSKHPQWWEIESISPEIRNKTRVPTLTTTIQHSVGSVGHSSQGRKRNKRNPDWKRRSETLTVCRWHDPLHRKP